MSCVDVFVPCYNYGRFLRECVESVLTQDGVGVRVLIIDDASSDDSEQVGRALAARDGRVEYRRHIANRGHITTYNEGLDWAAGDYVVLLSADDVLFPGALLRAANVMDNRPDVGMVYGRHQCFMSADELPQGEQCLGSPSHTIWPGAEWIDAVCRRGSNNIASPEVVVRTQLQKAIGGYDIRLPHTADLDMWLRCALWQSVAFVDAVQAGYRHHGANMHCAIAPRLADELEHIGQTFNTFFKTHGRCLPDRVRLQELALAAVSRKAIDGAYSAFRARDTATSRRLLEIANVMYPECRAWKLHSRVKWMLRLGPGTWSLARRLTLRAADSCITQGAAPI